MKSEKSLNNKKKWHKPEINELEFKLTENSKTFEALEFEKDGFGGNAGDDRHPS